MSDITGNGFGATHDWVRGYTGAIRATLYQCKRCGESFWHHYPSTPSIFQAMAESGTVSEKCGAQSENG